MPLLSDIYAAAARRRRERFAARADLRRRLRHPVVSIGNLAVGGRGKTPVVACVARLLLDAGERPAILSRGYARQRPEDGVVVVSDPDGLRADLPRAGDEPLMLARRLPGVSVVVSADRYLAGRLAEHHLGATVHLLDDGFQHLPLERDVDIVIVAAADLEPGAQLLPLGRLREPRDALVAADAVLALEPHGYLTEEQPFEVFALRKSLGAPLFDPPAARGTVPAGPVLAVAGIARPEGFFDDARSAGWDLAGTVAFRDHHPYTARDTARIWNEARASKARAVLTTEKDYVRLLPFRPFPVPVAYLPLTMEPEPLPEFRRWLAGSLRAARDIILD